MFGASFSAKNIAYKCLVRPHLEYACPVWSPFTSSNIKLIESVQHAGSVAPGIHDHISGPNHWMTVLVNCNGHPCSLDGNSCHCQSCMIFGRGVLELLLVITLSSIHCVQGRTP